MANLDDIHGGAERSVDRTDDEWIVVRCQLGERAAFDELIEHWQRPLWTYVRRMTGQDEAAGEVLQDVWLRVLRGISRLREGSRLRAWLFGIARRAVMDRLRAQYAQPTQVEVEELADLEAREAPDDPEEDLRALEGGLARLPAVEREVLVLFYLQELSLADVADIMRVPIGTIKSRLFRARQMLRRELEQTSHERIEP